MNVGDLRSRLSAFDDDIEVYLAPEIVATRIGENIQSKVPHPIHQFPVIELHVVGDIDAVNHSTGKLRVVLVFDGGNAAKLASG